MMAVNNFLTLFSSFLNVSFTLPANCCPNCDLRLNINVLVYFMGRGVLRKVTFLTLYLIDDFMWFLKEEEIKDIHKKPHHQEPHT